MAGKSKAIRRARASRELMASRRQEIARLTKLRDKAKDQKTRAMLSYALMEEKAGAGTYGTDLIED